MRIRYLVNVTRLSSNIQDRTNSNGRGLSLNFQANGVTTHVYYGYNISIQIFAHRLDLVHLEVIISVSCFVRHDTMELPVLEISDSTSGARLSALVSCASRNDGILAETTHGATRSSGKYVLTGVGTCCVRSVLELLGLRGILVSDGLGNVEERKHTCPGPTLVSL